MEMAKIDIRLAKINISYLSKLEARAQSPVIPAQAGTASNALPGSQTGLSQLFLNIFSLKYLRSTAFSISHDLSTGISRRKQWACY